MGDVVVVIGKPMHIGWETGVEGEVGDAVADSEYESVNL